jgi:tRNA (adenine57-N1/adenine58-N1)-methyltransferase
MTNHKVSENDIVALLPLGKGDRICVRIEDKSQKISGLGVYNTAKLIGKAYGSSVQLGKNKYWLLPANTMDHLNTLTRKAQIIIPKDAAQIGLYGEIKPGSVVVEGGVGSGALTIFLLSLVGNTGRVISYETRSDFAKIGKSNIEKAGLVNSWELKLQNITEGISEENVDAVILDIPEPWSALATAYQALRPGGALCCYVPTMNQVEKMVTLVRSGGFVDIHTYETLQRELEVGSGGTRPAFDMLGHTGYITFARKVLKT